MQLVSEKLPDGTSLARNYDDLGRPSGIALDANVAVGYSYDAVGRFSSLSSSVSSAIQYSYAPGSDLVAGWSKSSGFVFARTYEANRDLIAQVENTHNGTLIHRFEYENDPLGRRTLRKDTDLSDVITNLFGYNTGSELIEAAMGTNDYGYQYDAIGNRTVVTNNQGALTYLSNELNQYTNIANGVTNAPSYDADGNMTSHAGWTFAWDAENRLLAASNGTTVVHNAYDYMSRRVVKASGGITNRFLYDGWNMIRSISTAATNHYVWGLDLSGTLQGAGGIGGLLSAREGANAYAAAYDANGNVSEYVADDGTVVAHYEYDPYGNVTAASGSLAGENPFRFSSKYTDDETGLVYYGYRSYSPQLGRWVSRDPIGEAGSVGIYAVLANDSVNAVDLHGLITSGRGWPFNPYDTLGLLNDIRAIFGAHFDMVSRSGLRREAVASRPTFDERPSQLACCGIEGETRRVLGVSREGLQDAPDLTSRIRRWIRDPLTGVAMPYFFIRRTLAVEHFFRWKEITYKCVSHQWQLQRGSSPWQTVVLHRWSETFTYRWNTVIRPPPNSGDYEDEVPTT